MPKIDINCDMGESYGYFKIADDAKIFPYISSCNIACGFHGGDPLHIDRTIKAALKYHVRIGAHPSYPDLAGFGRRKMELDEATLKATIKYQIAALKGMVESQGGKLVYVKPHGALYNTMSISENETITVIEAIKEIDSNLALMGLANSIMATVAKKMKIVFIPEAFVDRRYERNGQLVKRSKAEAIINDSETAVKQAISIIENKNIRTLSGVIVPIYAESLCVHGDNSNAIKILKVLKNRLHDYNPHSTLNK